ncbi:MAG: hypothetical protein NTW86_16025, partial [Candidatus Sumerlaeota bacterium]|nr:hypothetical protein [Candidatus Sumerlaeota bacterium]
ARRTARGLWESLLGYYAREPLFDHNGLFLAFSAIGWIAAAAVRRWDLLFLPLLLALPTAFLAERVGVFDPRLVVHLVPFLGFLAGTGLEATARFVAAGARDGKEMNHE